MRPAAPSPNPKLKLTTISNLTGGLLSLLSSCLWRSALLRSRIPRRMIEKNFYWSSKFVYFLFYAYTQGARIYLTRRSLQLHETFFIKLPEGLHSLESSIREDIKSRQNSSMSFCSPRTLTWWNKLLETSTTLRHHRNVKEEMEVGASCVKTTRIIRGLL